jgi:A nuclease of the HNH/ENDO VII superfamily with conserved WHH
MMTRSLWVVVTLGLIAATASADSTELRGHWVWRGPMTGDQPHQFSPEAACKFWIRYDFKQTHIDRQYVGVKPPKDPSTSNDYTCSWIDKSDSKKKVQDSIAILAASYICPAETLMHTLNNSGKVADYRCRCDDGKVCSEGPPYPDTTARCQQQSAPTKKPSKADVDAQSKKLQKDVAQYADKDFMAEYKYLRQNEAVVRECDFKPADLCDGINDINVGLLCGFRNGDEAAANNLAGNGATPDKCTWHHHQDFGRMQLVKTAVHQKCSHDGGVSIWKEALGMKSYPNAISQ